MEAPAPEAPVYTRGVTDHNSPTLLEVLRQFGDLVLHLGTPEGVERVLKESLERGLTPRFLAQVLTDAIVARCLDWEDPKVARHAEDWKVVAEHLVFRDVDPWWVEPKWFLERLPAPEARRVLTPLQLQLARIGIEALLEGGNQAHKGRIGRGARESLFRGKMSMEVAWALAHAVAVVLQPYPEDAGRAAFFAEDLLHPLRYHPETLERVERLLQRYSEKAQERGAKRTARP